MIRVQEGDEILDEISTGLEVFACMLGDDDGYTVFSCTESLTAFANLTDGQVAGVPRGVSSNGRSSW